MVLNKMRPIFLPFIISLLSFSTYMQAEEPAENWYQIEYVLFEHLYSDRHVLRFEDVKYAPTKRDQYYYLTTNKQSASPFQLKTIDDSVSDFTNITKRISNSRDLKIFSTGSWQQAIKKGQKPPPIKITGGTLYQNDSRFQLEGELQIYRERYMHAEIDVFLADFKTYPYSDIKDWFFESEDTKWPLNWLLQPLSTQAHFTNKIGYSLIPENVIHFNQRRRIKDAEIHYIDHPAMGLLITIKEIEPPFEYGVHSFETSS